MILLALAIPVALLELWRAKLRLKPGSITADGSIVTYRPNGSGGHLTTATGPIWIAAGRLSAARKFGWREASGYHDPRGELVAVER